MYRYCSTINCPPGQCCDGSAYCTDSNVVYCYDYISYYYYDDWWIYLVIGISILIIFLVIFGIFRRRRRLRNRSDQIIIESNPSYVQGRAYNDNNINQGRYIDNTSQPQNQQNMN